ncbi:hypothetical protein [Sorangium sp. So ce1182]|uniref:hypothetical protein n=1 Tax=Sorangium sp. So ce1182 TaxID=3133334 RepID=UPI003F624DDD
MTATRTTRSARVGLKAAALLVLGAGVALVGASCSYEVPPLELDPYYHGCPYECAHYPEGDPERAPDPRYVWFGKPSEAPSCASVGLFDALWEGAYGDLKDPAGCPRCLCEARPCLPPTTLEVYSMLRPEAKGCDEADNSYTFMPAGWDGRCFAPRERFAEKAERVVKLYSHEPFDDHEPCRAYPAPEDVAETWGTFAVMCLVDHPALHRCGASDELCLPPKPEGFRTCIRAATFPDDPPVSCPPELPERFDLHRELGGCTPCFCDEVEARECEMSVSTYADMRCTQPISTRPLTEDRGECVDTPGEAGTKSVSVAVVSEQRATCQPGGGKRLIADPLQGTGANVYCCEPAPGG